MNYKADLHIHTVLSPCGDLSMSPSEIIKKAVEKNIDIIGITDHNSSLNAEVTHNIGKKNGVYVMLGVEVNTREEVHSICFMPDMTSLNDFQDFLDSKQTFFPNSPDKFGDQFIVDENENIIGEIEHLLINSLDLSINELADRVAQMNGIFIPAHVDRPRYSISSQLGIVPDNLNFNVMELSPFAQNNDFLEKFPWFKNYNYITNSDAHFITDIGKSYNCLQLEHLCFDEIKTALKFAILNFPKL
ncbi:MAG: PHP domain-containing protein [Bacteroidales bacterium]|nr:PHP domain-containing protein [Bacteroidales bacterium]MDD4216088.1 PHP domain-containing protein [Bacteroidales bacterium]MDY0141194.1 PHP domain-containing protein [Bacteroidales bacterium]